MSNFSKAPCGSNHQDIVPVLLGIPVIKAVSWIVDNGEKAGESARGGIKVVKEHDGIGSSSSHLGGIVKIVLAMFNSSPEKGRVAHEEITMNPEHGVLD